MTQLAGSKNVLLTDSLPIGAIVAFPFAAIPAGYVECNGQALSRSSYTALFTLIGVSYGVGDGSTTFNVPDYRGRFLRHNDNGKGLDLNRTLGSAQADELKSHIHSIVNLGSRSVTYNGGSYSVAEWRTDQSSTTASIGGTETRPVNSSVVYCIKAQNVALDLTGFTTYPITFAPVGHISHVGESSLLASNGYKKFADGLMLQWGSVNVTTSGTSVAFPIVFPHALLSCMATANYATTPSNSYVSITNALSLSSLVITASLGTPNVFWQAIGY